MIVAVWNMAKRPAAWGHLLDILAPDLALLQETPPPPDQSGVARLLHDPDYASNSLGSAIYLRDGAARPLELQPDHRVWFMAAEVELPGIRPVVAVSVHTPTVPSVRPFVDEAFEELAAGGPVLRTRSTGRRTTPSS